MMNYIKRRFSSGDLQGELKDEREYQQQQLDIKNAALNINNNNNNNIVNNNITNQNNINNNVNKDKFAPSAAQPIANNQINRPNAINTNPQRKGPSPSAPSSPTKTLSLTAMMSAARDIIASNVNTTNPTQMFGQNTGSLPRQMTAKEKTKLLLVIDTAEVDWTRYFKNRKIGEFELRVEQAEFKDISLASYVDSGTIIDIMVDRNGSKVIRSFKPDFVLIRQHVRNIDCDWRNVIIGLQYGCVPSVNSLNSVYNFRDKPWVFSQLVQIQKKYGSEMFPLINQTYHPNYKEMIRSSFPCIVKVGHAHQGLGKIKIDNALDFQDISSIVSISNSYSTTEPYIESKCDVHIQKIGDNYKAYMRKSITGNWKANTGSAMLEQIQISDKYKFWIDEVSKMFGGLDICAVQAVVELDTGKEYIIDVNDCALTLMGESQDSDRKLIAELVLEKMLRHIRKGSTAAHNAPMSSSNSSNFAGNENPSLEKRNIASLNQINNVLSSTLSSITSLNPNSNFSSSHPDQSVPTQTVGPSGSSVNLSSKKNSPFSSTQSIREMNSGLSTSNVSQSNSIVNQNTTQIPTSTSNLSNSSVSNPRLLPNLPSRPQSPTKNQPLPHHNQPQSSQQAPSSHHPQQPPGHSNIRQPQQQFNQQPQQQKPMNMNQKPKEPLNNPAVANNRNPTTNSNSLNKNLPTQNSLSNTDDSEDTMNNLRKTFAGIFGNSNL